MKLQLTIVEVNYQTEDLILVIAKNLFILTILPFRSKLIPRAVKRYENKLKSLKLDGAYGECVGNRL